MAGAIGKINGVDAADISKLNAKDVADIAEVNGKELSSAPAATLSLSPVFGAFDGDGNYCDPFLGAQSYLTVTVTASAGNSWTASDNRSWISITSGSGTGNGSFRVYCTSNGGSARFGTVTVTSSAPNDTVGIDQGGNGEECEGGELPE
jgi:hypothetical protein